MTYIYPSKKRSILLLSIVYVDLQKYYPSIYAETRITYFKLFFLFTVLISKFPFIIWRQPSWIQWKAAMLMFASTLALLMNFLLDNIKLPIKSKKRKKEKAKKQKKHPSGEVDNLWFAKLPHKLWFKATRKFLAPSLAPLWRKLK